MLRGDASPDALTRLHQNTGADQTLDDPRGCFRRDLKGVLQSVDGDEWRAAMDDFFENGPDDFGTASRIPTIQLHNASLDSGGNGR